jgi:hypothetical protein
MQNPEYMTMMQRDDETLSSAEKRTALGVGQP